MSEVLSFPGLGWEFELNRVAFSIGSKPIYWYGIIFATAFLVGTAYLLAKSAKLGVNSDRALDVVLGAFVAGIVCARLYFVAFSWDLYKDNPISALYIWEGGIGFYGGIIGAFVAGYFLCKWREVYILPMLDLAGPALLIAQAIGRWGNFVNMEAFGTNTDLPWGMTSRTIQNYLSYHANQLGELGMNIDPSMPVHPTFFYESAWNIIGFLIIGLWLVRHRKFDGQMFISYLIWYGAGRAVIEGMRTDSLMWGNIRVSQAVAVLCVIAGAVVMYLLYKRAGQKDAGKLGVLFSDTEEGKLTATGEFYKLSAEEKLEIRRADAEKFGLPFRQTESFDEASAEEEIEEAPQITEEPQSAETEIEVEAEEDGSKDN